MNKKLIAVIMSIYLLLVGCINVSGVDIDKNDKDICYGFIISINKNQSEQNYTNYILQCNVSQLINELLHNKLDVYWICDDLTALLTKRLNENNSIENNFEKGSYIVPFSSSDKDNLIKSIIIKYDNLFGIIYKIFESMSDVKAFKLVEPKIAYHGGYNVYWTHYDRVLKEGGFLFTSKLEWGNISKKLNNNDFNVFMWAGLKGDWKDLFATKFHILDYLSIRRFVRNGGGYIGSCYGASEISSGRILPINFIKACLPQLPSWPKLAFTTYASTRALPGGSWYGLTVKIKDSDNPIAFGLKSEISNCSYWSGPMFLGLKGKTKVVATIKGIDRAKWDFSNRMPEHPIPQSLLDLWINFSIDKPIWITTEFGNGKVVAFGDHPERMFFYDVGYIEGPPPRILFNAVRYASSIGPTSIDVNVLG